MKTSASAILHDLVAIDSVNPSLDNSARGEGALADYIEARCRKVGLKVSRQTVFPSRDNLIIELRAGHAHTLLLEAHMDTVPLGAMPLAPTVRDGRLFGRGACDTKGALAAMLFAMENAAAHPELCACDVVLCCTVDEEYGMCGIKKIADLPLLFAGAVVGEPTGLRVVIAHKGCVCFAVETRGRAAHSSVPGAGDSAITQMLRVLRFIEQIEPRLRARHHPLCGSPSLVVGTIRGGTQPNIVPEQCEIEIDRRVVPGEDAREVFDEFKILLQEAMRETDVNASVRELFLAQPLDTSPNENIVKCAQSAARSLCLNSEVAGVGFSSHAGELQQSGVPSIVFGPGSIELAHGANESVPLEEVEQAAQFYGELIRTFAPK